MNRIAIKRISTETKAIYVLWSVFVTCLLAYLVLIAMTMVYGVERKTAHRAVSRITQQLADQEATLISEFGSLALEDARTIGLVSLETRVAVSGDVRLGLAAR
jgi:cell division protein FtsL